MTPWIAKLDPAHCAGIHLNMLLVMPPEDAKPDALSEAEQKRQEPRPHHLSSERREAGQRDDEEDRRL